MRNIKIIDNFLSKDDFNELSNLEVKETKCDNIDVYNNSIDKNGLIKASVIKNTTINRLFNNYHSKAIEILKELSSKKVDLYEYSEFHIINTGANYKFPIHDDTPNKLLSGVIYLKPIKNSGTYFYDNKKGDNKKEVEWKQNRAVFFSRAEQKTWHSFKGDGVSSRLVLVYNLMTTNIKKVSEIENKNYFLTKTRFIINPVLYKYFKITF